MEIATGIHRIETAFGERINAVYYLNGAERSLLVDTGTRHSAAAIVAAIEDLGGRPPDYVVNTHCDWDHAAGNGTIRAAAPDAAFVAHVRDRAMIEDVDLLIDQRYGEFADDHGFDESDESKAAVRDGTSTTSVDIAITGGEEFRLEPGWTVTILHTPGHSHGSISVHDPRSSAVIVGDAVLGSAVPLASGDPAFPPTYRYVDDYLTTAERLAAIQPDLLLTGHYPVYEAGAALEFLAETRAFVEKVEGELEGAISSGEPRGLLDVAESISGSLGTWPQEAAGALLFPLTGHVERMVADGRAVATRSPDGRVRYGWVA